MERPYLPNIPKIPKNNSSAGKFFLWLEYHYPDFKIMLWHGCFIGDYFLGYVNVLGIHTRGTAIQNPDFSKSKIWDYLQQYLKEEYIDKGRTEPVKENID